MKIVISPFSKKLRDKDTPHPKNFPLEKWKELIQLLDNHEIIQIGVEGEERLVDKCYFNLPAKELIEFVSDMDGFISVENFFPHFVNFNFPEKRGIVIFSKSDPEIFGYPQNINYLKNKQYLRWDQFGPWEYTDFIEESFPEPIDILDTLNKIK